MTPQFPDPTEPEAAKLARYLSGECTAAERADIERRASVDSVFVAELDKLRAAWAKGTGRGEYDASRLWDRVAADTVNASTTGFPASAQAQPRAPRTSGQRTSVGLTSSRGWQWLPLAAAIVLVAGSLTTVTLLRRAEQARVVEVAPPMREVATRRAQRAEVYLSDGTRVVLGVASKLRFAGAFGATRDVYLEGEAYFDVAHDTRRPFAVHTERGVARDLGTKFSVRSYTDDRAKELEVVVEEGIVALGKAATGDSVLLRAKDLGRVTANGRLEAERGVDVAALLGWTEGRLSFRNTRFGDALPVLARWYDVEVSVSDPALTEYPITLTLTSERFTDAVDVLTRALHARVERRGDEFIFHPARR